MKRNYSISIMLNPYKIPVSRFYRIILLVFVLVSFAAAGQNLTKPTVSCPGGVRVNTYTGNLFLQRTDLFLDGRMPLDISFSYNSAQRNQDKGYGKGWTFRYGMQYRESGDTLVIIRGDGRKDSYKRSAGNPNVYTPPAGIFDSLSRSGNTFQLREADGTKYLFGSPAHKRLTRVEDRYGNALAFTYGDSLITRITDQAGRAVNLQYSTGRLVSVVETNGGPVRTYRYQYNNARQLTSVTDPLGFTQAYTYFTNGPINSVKDRNDNVVDIIYNGNFSVKEVVSCLTRHSFTYRPASNTCYVTELVNGENQLTTYRYNATGNLIEKSGNCCGYNIKYSYDSDRNISQMTDANGNVYSYTYDNKGNRITETDPLRKTVTYAYEPAFSRVTSVRDKNGNAYSYTYDQHGNLTQAVKPGGMTESFTYADNGDLLSSTDAAGNQTTYSYTTYGMLQSVQMPLGSAIALAYDTKGRLISETDPNSNTTTYAYDALNRIVKKTDATGGVQEYTYDGNGNLTRLKDENGHITSLEYDAGDRRVKITDALGQAEYTGYDARGNRIFSTDRNSHTSLYEYDSRGRLVQQKNAAGEATVYDYDNNGNVVSLLLPNGQQYRWTYDKLDRPVRISDDIGPVAEYAYDNNGNRISTTDGNGMVKNAAYDGLNRLVSVTDAFGNSESYAYDVVSNLVSYTDVNGKTTAIAYDALDRVISETDPAGHTTLYSYDATGNTVSVKDPRGNSTAYSYDARYLKTGEQYADGSALSMSYDAAGNLIAYTDANGVTVTYSYDALNRLLTRQYPGAGNDQFTYDRGGRMLSAVNASATIRYAYDAANRPVSETLNEKTTAYVYDTRAGKRTIRYPSGRVVEERYDARSRLAEVHDEAMQLAQFTYDAANRNTSVSYANGITTDISFDVKNRITSIASGSLLNFSYAYDNSGNKLYEKKLHRPGASEQYEYDDKYQLTGYRVGTLSGNTIAGPVKHSQFSYDAAGNRTSALINGVALSYTSNPLNAYTSLTGESTVHFGYDANGNLTDNGRNGYAYNADNNIVSVNNDVTASYSYDALGRRIQKITPSGTVNYYFDGHRIIETRDGSDELLSTFAYGSRIDHVIAMKRNGEDYFYHYNAVNSVVVLSASSGQVVEHYDYDVFGQPHIYDHSLQPLTGSSAGNLFFFTGREFDFETHTYYYRNRTYDPATGKFEQRDPLGLSAGINVYAYVENNPVNRVDPFGTDWVESSSAGLGGNPLAIGDILGKDSYADPCNPLRKNHKNGREKFPWDDFGLDHTADGLERASKLADKLTKTTTPLKTTGNVEYYYRMWANQHARTVEVNKGLTKGLTKVLIGGAIIANIGVAGFEISEGYQKDGNTWGENARVEVAGVVGGAGGAWAGAKIGILIGTPGGPIGIFIGGVVGAIGVSLVGEKAVEYITRNIYRK